MIKWLLDWYAQPEDMSNRSLMDGFISGSGTDNDGIGTERGTRERGTDKMEDYDE